MQCNETFFLESVLQTISHTTRRKGYIRKLELIKRKLFFFFTLESQILKFQFAINMNTSASVAINLIKHSFELILFAFWLLKLFFLYRAHHASIQLLCYKTSRFKIFRRLLSSFIMERWTFISARWVPSWRPLKCCAFLVWRNSKLRRLTM